MYHSRAAAGSPAFHDFSFSDRVRYYWPVPEVQEALARLLANLTQRPAPLALMSQYLPWALEAVHSGAQPNEPRALIRLRIREVTRAYAHACRGASGEPALGRGRAEVCD